MLTHTAVYTHDTVHPVRYIRYSVYTLYMYPRNHWELHLGILPRNSSAVIEFPADLGMHMQVSCAVCHPSAVSPSAPRRPVCCLLLVLPYDLQTTISYSRSAVPNHHRRALNSQTLISRLPPPICLQKIPGDRLRGNFQWKFSTRLSQAGLGSLGVPKTH